jgi:hypothetical protein
MGIFSSHPIKAEPPSSESESEEFMTDDAVGIRL